MKVQDYTSRERQDSVPGPGISLLGVPACHGEKGECPS